MKRIFFQRRMWVALSVALVAAVALMPGSWSASVLAQYAPEPTSTSTSTATTTAASTSTATTTATATATFTATPTAAATTLPTTGGTVTVPNAGLTLSFGQGVLGANTKVDFKPLVSPPVAPAAGTAQPTLVQQNQAAQQTNTTAVQTLAAQNVPPPPGVSVGGGPGGVIQSLFQLDATNTTNNSNVTTFNAPVILAIVVPPGTLSLAGGNLANVQVFRFNETTRVWIQVACTSGAGGLSCSTSGFSIWAMVVVTPAAVGPAQQAPVAPRPAATGTGVTEDSMSLLPMMALVLVAGSLVGVGAYAVQRRRS